MSGAFRRTRRLLPGVYFLGLAAAVAYPWFSNSGLLFLLDFVWPPTLQPPTDLWRSGFFTSLPHLWAYWALARALTTPVAQKMVFIFPFVLAGLVMFHLARFRLRNLGGTFPLLVALAAGTFYAWNAFTVSRLLVGHHFLLLAYALTPWAILAFLRFLEHPTVRRGLGASAVALATMLSNAHHFLLLPLLLLALASRPRPHARRWTGLIAFLTPLAAAAAAGLFFYRRVRGTLALPFDPRMPWAASLAAPFSGNPFLDALAGTGRWEGDYHYFFPHELLPGFALVITLLLLLVGFGAVTGLRQPATRFFTMRLIILLLAGVALAVGVAHPITEPLAAWLYRMVPFWQALRDSGKFLTVTAFAESLLLAQGITFLGRALAARGRAHRALWVHGGALTLTLGLASVAFRGVHDQVLPSDYPASWYEWNVRLADRGGRPRLLFLPWHQAIGFGFTDGHSVSNPAERFFTAADVVAGDNVEIGGTRGRPFIASESRRPISHRVEALLRDSKTLTRMGERLAPESIRYVALATDTWDAERYAFLRRQKDLRLVFEAPELIVWENIALASN